ncbi:GNAT family N-acetyltransferase [Aquihabitans daechungensis]|uniref:GNAT family N-acetyltransferase n=1 Tax=Aquihabitans daechungensis TaxID=1052257 RepID=UPI003B9DD458
MSTGLVIRAEQTDDVGAVRTLVADAFGDDALAVLLDDLRTSVAWLDLSFVAELDGEIVGHVAYTRAWVDDPAELIDVLVLSPLSIRPDHASKGIGTALVIESLDQLADRDEPLVFLEGDPGYYSRLGFVAGEPLGFRSPSVRIPPGAFQVRPLPGRPGRVTGSLVYPDVWWRHDAVGLRSE